MTTGLTNGYLGGMITILATAQTEDPAPWEALIDPVVAVPILATLLVAVGVSVGDYEARSRGKLRNRAERIAAWIIKYLSGPAILVTGAAIVLAPDEWAGLKITVLAVCFVIAALIPLARLTTPTKRDTPSPKVKRDTTPMSGVAYGRIVTRKGSSGEQPKNTEGTPPESPGEAPTASS